MTPSTDKCAACGFPKSEHHFNGACYGVCGEFKPMKRDFDTIMEMLQIWRDADHDSAAVIQRNDVITIIEGVKILREQKTEDFSFERACLKTTIARLRKERNAAREGNEAVNERLNLQLKITSEQADEIAQLKAAGPSDAMLDEYISALWHWFLIRLPPEGTATAHANTHNRLRAAMKALLK